MAKEPKGDAPAHLSGRERRAEAIIASGLKCLLSGTYPVVESRNFSGAWQVNLGERLVLVHITERAGLTNTPGRNGLDIYQDEQHVFSAWWPPLKVVKLDNGVWKQRLESYARQLDS